MGESTLPENREKVFKSIYIVLKKFHRETGLAVLAWSGPEGTYNPYLDFYFLGVRREDGSPRFGNELGSMRIHQHRIATAQPLQPSVMPDQGKKELRSNDIADFFMKSLDIERNTARFEKEIAAWRPTWSQARAERFLLAWKIVGQFASKHGLRLENHGTTPAQHRDPFEGRHWVEALGLARPNEDVIWCGDLAFITDARVYGPRGRVVDLAHLQNAGAEDEALLWEVEALSAGKAENKWWTLPAE